MRGRHIGYSRYLRKIGRRMNLMRGRECWEFASCHGESARDVSFEWAIYAAPGRRWPPDVHSMVYLTTTSISIFVFSGITLLVRLLPTSRSSLSSASRGPEARDDAMRRFGVDREYLVEAFGAARDDWMGDDFDGWLAANSFYEASRCAKQRANKQVIVPLLARVVVYE